MKAQDLILDTADDIQILNGDFNITDSDKQHIEDLLIAAPGHFKEFPLAGCNLFEDINGNSPKQKIINKIAVQLKADGYNVKGIDFTYGQSGTLVINKIDADRL